jgi:hypothetical protein
MVPLAITLAAGILAMAGWQTGWPSAVFGAREVSSLRRSPIPSAAQSGSGSALHAAASGASTSTPAASSPPAASPGASGLPAAPQPSDPAATVRAYVAAINSKDYAKAWQLGGNKTGASSYAAYVQGFNGTARDSITILSVSGNIVSAQLAAQQANGTVKTYRGTYIVIGGIITQFDVRQIS